MIISKDLFIFGEHIFATIIPEVQSQSIPLQQEQTQQKEIDEKSVDPQKKLVVDEIEGRGSLSQQETVAVVFVATSAATGKLTTKKVNKVSDQSLLANDEHNLELNEKHHKNHITRNGSIKIINTNTTTNTTTKTSIINNKEETGNIEGKKINLQQKQKKAKEATVEDKEAETYNKIRRPKEKLLVAEDNAKTDTNTNTSTTTFGKSNDHFTEEETTVIEEEEEQIVAEQQPLVQRNLINKLKTVSSSQQVEGENPPVSTNSKFNNIQDNNAR